MSDWFVITGSSKGIGLHLTQHYLSLGYQVIGVSRSAVESEHENYQHLCCDVANERDVKKVMSHIRKQYGRLDVLINNAGTASMNHFVTTPTETMDRLFKVNVFGTMLFSREASKLIKKGSNGRIINFTIVEDLTRAGLLQVVSSEEDKDRLRMLREKSLTTATSY